jgi:predicted TPR repeat methyltransferase
MDSARMPVPDRLSFLRSATTAALGKQNARAERLLRRALALDPAFAEAHNNLGNALRALGRPEAAAAYRRTLRLRPDNAAGFYNLAGALKAAGEGGDAEQAYRRALALAPAHAEAHNNRANLALTEGQGGAAASGYLRALAIRPDWEDAHGNLADALTGLHDEGDAKEAGRLAALWRLRHPGHPIARHTGVALAGGEGDRRAGDVYVRQEFDRFADSFEETLAGLGYRAPALLAAALDRAGVRSAGRVLDAGCGTGLCAPFLRPLAERLVGVDLSPGMLAKARALGLYDRLVEAELEAFLERTPEVFDRAVAADVFCYFGVLDAALAGLARVLVPGGMLAFSVEALEEGGTGNRLLPHGRYAHTRSYVGAALENAGFGVTGMARDTVRMEGGAPVAAWIVTASRRPPRHRP